MRYFCKYISILTIIVFLSTNTAVVHCRPANQCLSSESFILDRLGGIRDVVEKAARVANRSKGANGGGGICGGRNSSFHTIEYDDTLRRDVFRLKDHVEKMLVDELLEMAPKDVVNKELDELKKIIDKMREEANFELSKTEEERKKLKLIKLKAHEMELYLRDLRRMNEDGRILLMPALINNQRDYLFGFTKTMKIDRLGITDPAAVIVLSKQHFEVECYMNHLLQGLLHEYMHSLPVEEGVSHEQQHEDIKEFLKSVLKSDFRNGQNLYRNILWILKKNCCERIGDVLWDIEFGRFGDSARGPGYETRIDQGYRHILIDGKSICTVAPYETPKEDKELLETKKTGEERSQAGVVKKLIVVENDPGVPAELGPEIRHMEDSVDLIEKYRNFTQTTRDENIRKMDINTAWSFDVLVIGAGLLGATILRQLSLVERVDETKRTPINFGLVESCDFGRLSTMQIDYLNGVGVWGFVKKLLLSVVTIRINEIKRYWWLILWHGYKRDRILKLLRTLAPGLDFKDLNSTTALTLENIIAAHRRVARIINYTESPMEKIEKIKDKYGNEVIELTLRDLMGTEFKVQTRVLVDATGYTGLHKDLLAEAQKKPSAKPYHIVEDPDKNILVAAVTETLVCMDVAEEIAKIVKEKLHSNSDRIGIRSAKKQPLPRGDLYLGTEKEKAGNKQLLLTFGIKETVVDRLVECYGGEVRRFIDSIKDLMSFVRGYDTGNASHHAIVAELAERYKGELPKLVEIMRQDDCYSEFVVKDISEVIKLSKLDNNQIRLVMSYISEKVNRKRRGVAESVPLEPKEQRGLQIISGDCIDEDILENVYNHYGEFRLKEILKIAKTDATLSGTNLHSYVYLKAEIVYAARYQMVVHLDDFLLRRTSLGRNKKLSDSELKVTADILGTYLGWNEIRRKIEIIHYKRIELKEFIRSIFRHVHSELQSTYKIPVPFEIKYDNENLSNTVDISGDGVITVNIGFLDFIDALRSHDLIAYGIELPDERTSNLSLAESLVYSIAMHELKGHIGKGHFEDGRAELAQTDYKIWSEIQAESDQARGRKYLLFNMAVHMWHECLLRISRNGRLKNVEELDDLLGSDVDPENGADGGSFAYQKQIPLEKLRQEFDEARYKWIIDDDEKLEKILDYMQLIHDSVRTTRVNLISYIREQKPRRTQRGRKVTLASAGMEIHAASLGISL